MDAYANTSGKQVGGPNSVQNPAGYTPTAMTTHLVEPLQETEHQVQIKKPSGKLIFLSRHLPM